MARFNIFKAFSGNRATNSSQTVTKANERKSLKLPTPHRERIILSDPILPEQHEIIIARARQVRTFFRFAEAFTEL